jgi:hypothetical protein
MSSNLSRDTNYPEIFRGIPQYLQSNAWIIDLKLVHDHVVPNIFKFIFH